ncbi:MAG TPA: hypothetical protein VHL10_00940 [Nitrososphaera sp.]|nr:hypothetical protein [Nitrososphaera sp.]
MENYTEQQVCKKVRNIQELSREYPLLVCLSQVHQNRRHAAKNHCDSFASAVMSLGRKLEMGRKLGCSFDWLLFLQLLHDVSQATPRGYVLG